MREYLTPILERMAQNDPNFIRRYRQSMLSAVVDAAIRITGADMGNIQLFDLASAALRIEAQRGFSQPFLEFFDCVHDGHAVCGTAFKTRAQIIVEDVAEPNFGYARLGGGARCRSARRTVDSIGREYRKHTGHPLDPSA